MLAIVLPVVIAPIIGSFLGVLIARLPLGRPVAMARSACDQCHAQLSAPDLVPLLSFAVQRGRCRHCGGRIGWFHPAVEAAALGVALWAALSAETPLQAWSGSILGWALLTLAWIDAVWLLLPDVLTLPLLLAGLANAAAFGPDRLFGSALGAAIGYLALRALAFAYRRTRGRDGIGGGDAKLLAAAGAWLGAGALPWVVVVAALSGLCWAAITAVRGQQLRAGTVLPFGPFLAVAIWLLWLYGPPWGWA